MQIAGTPIGPGHPPYIIAEMSGNHNQSLERAFELVDAAADAGAHAVKLQTYTADTITLDAPGKGFSVDDPNSLWHGKRLHDLYKVAHTPWDWHKPIMERAHKLGMACFSSPFDETAVDFLNDLGVPAFKIASFENNHIPLIRKVAQTGKPVIVSTGMASIAELDEAVRLLRSEGCENFVLLKCTSTYPATPENTNISTIPHLKQLFNCRVGLSDHTMGVGVAVGAVTLGACVVEKHFTLNRADGGVDSAFSLEPHELKALVEETLRGWQSFGTPSYGPTEKEKSSLDFRRSIYVAKDIKAGETFTAENLRVVRPAFGLAPKHYDEAIGKKATRDLTIGEPLDWSMVG